MRIKYGVNVVVAVNSFATDTPAEVELIRKAALEFGAMDAVVSTHWADGGAGRRETGGGRHQGRGEADQLQVPLPAGDRRSRTRSRRLPRKSMGRTAWTTAPRPRSRSPATPAWASTSCPSAWQRPTCPSLRMRRSRAHRPASASAVREVRASVGAGFIYPLLGKMSTMPGLPTRPVFYDVDLDLKTGKVVGLF